MVFIVLSSVELTFDSPLIDPTSTLHDIMVNGNIVFTIVFCIEALLKTIAFGFVYNGKHSYLRGYSNISDFMLVVFAVLDLFFATTLRALRLLRLLRILRPLRIIVRN